MAKNQSRQSETVPAKPQSLTEFVRAKAKKDCPVCALPVEVRAQIGRPATDKGITRREQAEWLRTVCGATRVTEEVLNAHLTAKHDREEDLNAS